MTAAIGERFDWIEHGGQRGRILDVTGTTPLYHVIDHDGTRRVIAHGPGITITKVTIADLARDFGTIGRPAAGPRAARIDRRAQRRMQRRQLRENRATKRRADTMLTPPVDDAAVVAKSAIERNPKAVTS